MKYESLDIQEESIEETVGGPNDKVMDPVE